MEREGRLREIDLALAALPEADRQAAAAPALAELCLDALDVDEDIVAALTRRAIYLAAAEGAVLDAPLPGGRPVLETAAELADTGLAPSLAAELRRLSRIAGASGCTHVAVLAQSLASRRDEALEALAVVLLTTALAE